MGTKNLRLSVSQPYRPIGDRLDKGRGLSCVLQNLTWDAPRLSTQPWPSCHLQLSRPDRNLSMARWLNRLKNVAEKNPAHCLTLERLQACDRVIPPRVERSLSNDDGRSSEPSPRAIEAVLRDPTAAASGQRMIPRDYKTSSFQIMG
ncbi:hypothetical protein N8I77_003975 [Diaporthe amygdali]|uniref:Uncharacterized protein n=1 Tax=Phomopsis amygdali TaxID=1214568 RepID=A0AAD9W871_PHOAM|nr:hypothetical protein N8I77_003975 [Diaporthe amygdali]